MTFAKNAQISGLETDNERLLGRIHELERNHADLQQVQKTAALDQERRTL